MEGEGNCRSVDRGLIHLIHLIQDIRYIQIIHPFCTIPAHTQKATSEHLKIALCDSDKKRKKGVFYIFLYIK